MSRKTNGGWLEPGKGRFRWRRCSRGMKRACAWMLCAGMVAGSGTANIAAAAASSGGEGVTEFKMTSKMLRGAMEKALLEGKPVDASAFDIQGEYAGDYDELLGGPEGDAKLYELSMPSEFKRKHRKAAVKLRVFVRLDEGCLAGALEEGGDEETADAGYEFCGDEEMIFLLSNDTENQQEAAVIVGGKTSSPIVVAPESQIDMGLRASVSPRASNVVMMPLASGSDADRENGDDTDGADSADGAGAKDESGVKDESSAGGEKLPDDGGSGEGGPAGSGISGGDSGDTGVSGGEEGPGGGGLPYATPSDADDYEEEISDATSSDAELEPLLGELYDAVLLDGHAVTAFAVPAAELGIGDVNLASSSDAVCFRAESENLSVTAWVKEDAVPETAELKVKELSEKGETGAGHRQAQNALDQVQIPYDDMLACDLYFEDRGERIEPDGGRVQVAMEVNREILPEDVSAGTLAVQHLREKPGGGITVERVAGAAENAGGGVEITDEAAVAEFKVDSFSKFTVTWGTGVSTDGKVAFRLLNTAGEPIFSEPVMEMEIKAGQRFAVASRMPYISGYDYQSAYCMENGVQVPVTELKAGDRSVSYRSEEGDFWKRVGSGEISVFYAGDGPTVTASDPDVLLRHEKKAMSRGDGTYDLTLTVSGAVGTKTEKQPLDVMFVLDNSGSMDTKTSAFGGETRAKAVGDAIDKLVDSLDKNENLNVEYSLISFHGDDDYLNGTSLKGGAKTFDDAAIQQEWTSEADKIKEKSHPKPLNLTNYQAGLVCAKKLMASRDTREGALKALIFLSDGEPNLYYNSDGYSCDDESDKYSQATLEELKGLDVDYFLTVGINVNGKVLQKMNDAMGEAGPANRYFQAYNTKELDETFDSIRGIITTLGCSSVEITDSLSEYVQMVKTKDGVFDKLKISVTDENGKKISETEDGTLELEDGTAITAEYDDKNKRIQLIFPEDYTLKPGCTYEVRAHIEPSDRAYEEYRQNQGAYPGGHMGEENTGSHAQQEGFRCNGTAELTYIYNGKGHKQEYPHPVVQIETGGVKVQKKVSGNMADMKKNFEFDYWIGEKNADTDEPDGSFTLKNDEEKLIAGYLRPGTKVTVREENYKLYGYTTSVSVGDGAPEPSREAQVVIGKENVTVTYENEYSLAAPMGIFSDSHPYTVMMLTASLGLGLAAFLKRKERAGDEEGGKS